jgi:hypothetical protein
VSAAIYAKHVQATIVVDPAQARYHLGWGFGSHCFGWSHEDASIQSDRFQNCEVAFPHAASEHSRQGAGDDCTKHLARFLSRAEHE